jgi:hypothetical protein
VKYKTSLTLILSVSALSIQAENTTSPLAIYAKPIDDLFNSSKALLTSETAHLWWEHAIQVGSFNDVLHLRMLLSEYYCARCGIAASGFTNSALTPANIWPVTKTQPAGWNVQPGGFNINTVGAFRNTAASYTTALEAARKKLEPASNFYSNKTQIPSNSLDTFAGVIIVSDNSFNSVLQYRGVAIPGHGDLGGKYGGKNVMLFAPQTKPTNNTVNVKVQGNALFKTNQVQATKLLTLCDITLTNNSGSVPATSTQLQSIKGKVLGYPINPIYGYAPQQLSSGQAIGTFFKNAPNNPWALVIVLSATTSSTATEKKIQFNTSIPALVQLNPYEFPSSNISNVNTLLGYPSALYNKASTAGTTAGSITPTGRLLRGITNGYLTSWSYHALANPNPMFQPWGNTLSAAQQTGTRNIYPTPGNFKFNNSINNNENKMLYALKGSLEAIKQMHLTTSALPQIQAIITHAQNNSGELPANYIPGISGKSYQPVFLIPKSSTAPAITPSAKTASASPKKGIMHQMLSHLSKPLRMIKNLFSKHITL